MRRLLPVSMLLLVACAHLQHRPESEQQQPIPAAIPLTPQAAAYFARAAAPDTVGSLVIDLDEMRTRGLLHAAAPGRSGTVDFTIEALAAVSSYLPNAKAGPMFARAAVTLGLLRAWDAWPHVQRIGVVLPTMQPQSLFIVLATPNDAATNEDLLRGAAAIDRATGKPLLTMQDGHLCASLGSELDAKFGPVCAAAGQGYIVFATQQSIAEAAVPPTTKTALPAPAFVRLHANAMMLGHGDLVADWQQGFHLAVTVTTMSPDMASKIEGVLNKALKSLDESRQKMRSTMAPVLDAAKEGVAHDSEAPSGLKKSSATVTLDSLLDPDGSYKEWRQSVRIARNGTTVSLTLTVPADSFRRTLKRYENVISTAFIAGIVAAIAIPNFEKFEHRAKESEAKANLKSLAVAQKAYYQEKGHYGKTFTEIGFEPERGNVYAYCMAGQCLPCTAKDCYMPPAAENKCIEMTREYANDDGSEGFLGCAIGDPAGKHDPAKLDVWTITEDGKPQHVTAPNGSED